jgi:predicted amidohydrolase
MLAKKYNIWLAGGTIPTQSQHPERFFATLPVYNPQGELVAHYQKIHLFDVDVSDNTGAYRESDTTAAGKRVVVFDIEDITVGLGVCYDVRFPGLFQQMSKKGAQIIVLPSAFTQTTGEAHWHALLRARAIENQVYMVAAGQVGIHANGRQTYGHSMIVDAWGEIIAEKITGNGWIGGKFDRQRITQVRSTMPIQQHNRFNSEFHHEFSRT